MAHKYINNSYDKLLDEITISTYISFYREDKESMIHGIIYDDRISGSVKSEINDFISNYVNSNDPNPNNLIVFLLASTFKKVVNLSNSKLTETKRTLSALIQNEVYPIGQKSHFNYLLSTTNSHREIREELDKYLTKKSKIFFQSGKEEDGILASYSLINKEFLQNHLSFCEKFIDKNHSGVDELSRISVFIKSIIYVVKNNKSNIDFGSKVESILSKSLKNDKSPDLWFAISVSEKIINSNLDSDVNQKILGILKESGYDWSELIDNIQPQSLTVNIKNSIQFSPPSVIDAYYSLQALELLDRNYVFSIPIEDVDNYTKFITKSELSTNYKSIYILSGFTALVFSLITIVLLQYKGIVESIEVFYSTKINPKSIESILKVLSNPIIIIGILLWWIYIIFSKIGPVYNITIFEILLHNPIILYLRKFFNNIKPKA